MPAPSLVNDELNAAHEALAASVDGGVLSLAELQCLREFFELLLEWREKADSDIHHN